MIWTQFSSSQTLNAPEGIYISLDQTYISLDQGYSYHKIYKAFIVSKYSVGLKTLLLQGLSEPEFYGDFVYEFRKIIGKSDFLIISKRQLLVIKRLVITQMFLRQTACLVVNPVKVNKFAYLFNCTKVGRASD